MTFAEMVKSRADFSGRQAPKESGPDPSAMQKEASGISDGTRSDKKPLVRNAPKGASGLAIWRTEGK